MTKTLIDHVTAIVAAHAGRNALAVDDLPGLIQTVHKALKKLDEPETEATAEKRKPAIAVGRSVTPEAIVCLECGFSAKMLKRHLRTGHGLSPEEYRTRWNLAGDYPLVAPLYSEERGKMAKAIGLGRAKNGKRKRKG